jgi:Ser-tRNA(Ala) deacylase AlaX
MESGVASYAVFLGFDKDASAWGKMLTKQNKKRKERKMALLACQRDAYQQEGSVEILSCEATQEGFLLRLADSILYPEGGGQPADRGWINDIPILDVQKDRTGGVLCRTAKAIPEGQAFARVDWSYRYAMMQQHSGQHLLTALALEHFGWITTSVHLGERYATIELNTPSISEAERQALEESANTAIRQALPIRWEEIDADAMESEGVRSRRLPSDHPKDRLRIVLIEGLDKNTCGGTHVASTAELQALALIASEKIRGQTRLTFLVGERLRQSFAHARERERALTTLLCTDAESLPERIQSLHDNQRKLQRAYNDAQIEIARNLGEKLAQQIEKRLAYHREGGDLPFLQALADAYTAHLPSSPTDRSASLLLLTASPDKTGDGVFLLVGEKDAVKAYAPTLTTLLQARGGGPPGRFQGKAAQIEGRHRFLET